MAGLSPEVLLSSSGGGLTLPDTFLPGILELIDFNLSFSGCPHEYSRGECP